MGGGREGEGRGGLGMGAWEEGWMGGWEEGWMGGWEEGWMGGWEEGGCGVGAPGEHAPPPSLGKDLPFSASPSNCPNTYQM